MATKTKNYGLNKHSPDDFYSVEARNENWDKIDETLKENADQTADCVKTDELAEKIKKTVTDGDLTAADLGAVSAADKGRANGVAGLGNDGKVLSDQLPKMDYDPSGTAANAVEAHNTASNAHSALLAKKQDKLAGEKGKLVGFVSDDEVGAVDAPSGIDAVQTAPETATQDSLSVTPDGVAYTGTSAGKPVMQYSTANITISDAEPEETLAENCIWMVYK